MQTALDCIPCFVRQALEAVRFTSDDEKAHERVLREVLNCVAELDMTQCPPVVGQLIHRRVREITGVTDPYREVKDRFNRLALKMLPELVAQVKAASNPLKSALQLAIVGNMIDFGVNAQITEDEVAFAVARALDEPLHGEVGFFRQALAEAESILYLADNAGEIVFDRLLIEQMPTERVAVAVRGGPVLNDATLADAQAAGLGDIVELIDNGSDAPATVLADCSPAFRRRFAQADLVVAKGQGNFETLSDEDAPVFFLFKVKCPLVAAYTELPLGAHTLWRGRGADGYCAIETISRGRAKS